MATAHGEERVTVRPREGQNGVVLVGVDVEVMRRCAISVGLLDHLGFETLGHPGVITADVRARARFVGALHHTSDRREGGVVICGLFRLRAEDLSLDFAAFVLGVGEGLRSRGERSREA